MVDTTNIIGTKLEQAEETRRLLASSDGEATVVLEIPFHPMAVKQTRVVIEKSDVSGDWLIWGVGSWGTNKWSDTTGSPEIFQVINYNDTFEEWFQTDRFNESGSTDADWTNAGSLVFPSGAEVMETKMIFAEPNRNATEVTIIPQTELGSFTYEVMTNESGSWMEIPENQVTILDGPGSNLRMRVGSPVGTGLKYWYKFNDDTSDSLNNLNGSGSKISPVPHVWY